MIRSCVETLADALDNSAEHYPKSKLCFSGFRGGLQESSLEDVAIISRRYACGLQQLGLQKGDLVGLHLSTRPEFIYSLIGTIRAGGVPVPLPTFSGFQGVAGFIERLAHIIEHSGAQYVITEERLSDWSQDYLQPETFKNHRWLTPREIDAAGEGAALIARGNPDLCLVQYTSGSTGAPKGVALTHRNVLAGLSAIADEIQLTAADVWCSWLPLYHDMGLIGMLCNLTRGASLYLSKPRSFIGNPGKWLSEFSQRGGTLYAGPSFSYTHMLKNIKDEQLTTLDLSRWRLAFNGSETIDPRVIEQFVQRFSPVGFRAEAMFPVYGMAEATLAVSFPTLGSELVTQWVDGEVLAEAGKPIKVARSSPQARGVVCVGKAVSEHAVRIVSPKGTVLSEDTVGEVQVKGPAVMEGYYADLKASAAVLRDGWLSTGDLGYLSEGQLFITGRAKEMMIVNGRKFYPQDIEPLVSSVAGVYKGRCVALSETRDPGEQVIMAVETDLSSQERVALIKNLRSLVSNRLGLFALRVCLLQPGSIPRTSSGKQQRLLLREQLRSGQLQAKLWPEQDYDDLLLSSQAS